MKVDTASPLPWLPEQFELISFDVKDQPKLLDEIGALRIRVWQANGV